MNRLARKRGSLTGLSGCGACYPCRQGRYNCCFGDAVALVQRHRDQVRRLITHPFPLEQAAPALEFALEHPAEAEKVIILLGDGS
jgi:threonine dehydrogenase-like Zn-dependent dehydrogenase